MRLLISFLLFSALPLCAESSLKPEAIAYLKVALSKAEGVPPDITPEVILEEMSEDMDLSLNKDDADTLSQGKAIRTTDELKALATQTESLKALPFPLPLEPLAETISNPKATEREREAAYRLLSNFNDQKLRRLRMLNVMRAKALFFSFYDNPKASKYSDLEGHKEQRYMSLTGEADWLFKREGFGSLDKIKDQKYSGKVILLAPSPILGKLVVCCDDGSVRSIPTDQLKQAIDLSGLKL